MGYFCPPENHCEENARELKNKDSKKIWQIVYYYPLVYQCAVYHMADYINKSVRRMARYGDPMLLYSGHVEIIQETIESVELTITWLIVASDWRSDWTGHRTHR